MGEIPDVGLSTNGGITWTNVLRLQGSGLGYPTLETVQIDAGSVAAGDTIRIRFHYYNAHYDWWWAVSDVNVMCGASAEDPYKYVYLPLVLRDY